ncbi:MAG TPA: hypothetical protein VG693_03930, partial [Actinomycetes bacterium]|nr:hypothetical protein [Actinomycetes bacterium]
MSYSLREVAERANVPESFVRRLVAVGALPAEDAGLGPREVRRARLLHSWTAAGPWRVASGWATHSCTPWSWP